MLNYVTKAAKSLMSWVSPEPPAMVPYSLQVARAMAERNRFSDLLGYREFDEENKLVMLEDGEGPAVGFALSISPLMVAGVDAEPQLEALINACPADTILMYGKLSVPQVEGYLNAWTNARLNTDNPVLRQIAERRRDFMITAATGPSMLPRARLHPRMTSNYLLVRVPFKGDMSAPTEIATFRRMVLDLRATLQGALQSTQVGSQPLDEADFKMLVRQLVNPHIESSQLIRESVPGVSLHQDIVYPNTRVTIQGDGRLGFGSAEGEPDVVVTTITADAIPRHMYLPEMARTLGDPVAWEERITCPYWAYTVIHVLHPDNAKDSLQAKMGLLNKQTMSESAWLRSMMPHLFERRDMAQELLKQTGKGHTLVRAFTGVNLYTPPADARAATEFVKGLWRRAGFRASEEKFISFPVFLATLPLQYVPSMDPPNKGLQRAQLMSSLNACAMLPLQGDWMGTDPSTGGPLFVSRAGQLASIDLLKTDTNYNFVVVAQSGSGKSFLTNEFVCDFLSKNGMCRIIDVGRSYLRFCERMNGQSIVFSPERPMSLNPFTDVRDMSRLEEMMPMVKDLLRLMAYPLTPEEQTPAFEYQLLEDAVLQSWQAHNEFTELRHIYEWLTNHSDPRAHDLATQLKPYAVGRFARWFSGRRSVDFTNGLVVIELEELKQDAALQSVVLQLVMYQVTKEMYLADRRIPKMLVIDEAWDLMGGLKTGKFIETSFRRIRKYNGIAGVITQSFEDFEKSPAARAAIENASWQFILNQKPESIEFAVANKRIVSDERTVAMVRSVKSGEGFSEVFVRGEKGSGLYRFVTDKHTYYTFTTRPVDLKDLADLQERGYSTAEAIHQLAMRDYRKMWGEQFVLAE